MKKVHIPGSVIFGFLLVAVCLFGLLQNASDGIDLRLVALLAVAVVFIVLFCRKNVNTVESKVVPDGRKPSKSKFVYAKEKDEAHQKKLLDLYMYQKEEYWRNARNGLVFGAVGILIVFMMWGYGKIATPVFAVMALFCVYYSGRCVWSWFINSDKPEARNIAAKFNMTTLQDRIEYTEMLILQKEEKSRLNGLPEDTIAFIEKDDYLDDKE
ncbi:MAG: hypothetical protein KBG42_11020 [Lachnospiraceae bacterium]|nr:hypothetical protein [Lachnospiraceae bacterium]